MACSPVTSTAQYNDAEDVIEIHRMARCSNDIHMNSQATTHLYYCCAFSACLRDTDWIDIPLVRKAHTSGQHQEQRHHSHDCLGFLCTVVVVMRSVRTTCLNCTCTLSPGFCFASHLDQHRSCGWMPQLHSSSMKCTCLWCQSVCNDDHSILFQMLRTVWSTTCEL